MFDLDAASANPLSKLSLQLYSTPVRAGFPSPAEDYIDKRLDLNEELITHPAATFFLRVDGDSMCDAGILNGDLLVVDRAVEPRNHHIVVCVVSGEFTVKRLRKVGGRVYLIPANGEYNPIEVTEDMDFVVWGVVMHAIHTVS
ncbi:MAG: peptidase S24 [Candidatus Hydrogenedentota bacterium]|nr:MAG: peptidase S24 [Candidatus Hydrogenedentota bacterium]